MCVDFDEAALATWLLDRGASANARAVVDAEGFGGHTPSVRVRRIAAVSDGAADGRRLCAAPARAGRDERRRASLRKRLRFVADETEHRYSDVTPLDWGARFHDRDWVNPAVVALLGG
jgi:hypothetical protein